MSDLIPCFNCDSEINIDFGFCPNCGSKVKCKNCNTPLVKSAKFCFECGDSVDGENKKNDVENVNTIEFKETKEERSYKVSFTNETASQVTNVVAGMIPNGSSIFKKTLTTDLVEFSEIKDFDKSIEGENKEPIPVEIVDDKSGSEKEEIKSGKDELIYHHIDDLPRKYENFSEKEWILVYAFYISDYGVNNFKKDDVYEKYKDARYTLARRKNFSKNWNDIFKDNFVTIKDDNLALTSKGIENCNNLLSGLVKPKINKIKNSSPNRANKPSAQNTIKMEEFDLLKNGGLQEIFDKANPSVTKEYILCIGYYINHILEKDYFSDGNVDFAFRALKISRPNTLRQIITNIKNNDLWVEKVEEKFWKLTRLGEIQYEKMIK